MSMPRALSALVGHSGRQPPSRNRLARRFLVTVDACFEMYNCCIGDGSVVEACATAPRLHRQRLTGKMESGASLLQAPKQTSTIAAKSLNHQAHVSRLQEDRLIKGQGSIFVGICGWDTETGQQLLDRFKQCFAWKAYRFTLLES